MCSVACSHLVCGVIHCVISFVRFHFGGRILGCDCGLRLWVAIVGCDCGLRLWVAIVGCDCGLRSCHDSYILFVCILSHHAENC
jgi:hypothetical protein